jgi:hypothetical protein
VLTSTAMKYLFSFVFKLVKIAIQASLYAMAARWLAQQADARQIDNVLVRASRNGRQFWQRSFVVAYVTLFLFSCTYWGDHGLGSARLPLGYSESIEEIDTEAYFEASVPFKLRTDEPWVSEFQVADRILCGQASDKSYFIYNLATKENRLFDNAHEYNVYAIAHGLPASGKLESFWKQYSRYWGGWRFWLLG